MSNKYLTPGIDWAYRDVLISLFITFLAVSALTIIMVPKANENLNTGRLLIQLFWDNKVDADIDLWVSGPNKEAVGYGHRAGKICDLLHDHQGFTHEGDYSNTEFVVCRQLPPGVYTINAAFYNSFDGKTPVKVWVKVQQIGAGVPVDLFKVNGVLTSIKEEITLINFRLDSDGKVVPGSQNNLPNLLWRN